MLENGDAFLSKKRRIRGRLSDRQLWLNLRPQTLKFSATKAPQDVQYPKARFSAALGKSTVIALFSFGTISIRRAPLPTPASAQTKRSCMPHDPDNERRPRLKPILLAMKTRYRVIGHFRCSWEVRRSSAVFPDQRDARVAPILVASQCVARRTSMNSGVAL